MYPYSSRWMASFGLKSSEFAVGKGKSSNPLICPQVAQEALDVLSQALDKHVKWVHFHHLHLHIN